MTRALGLLHVWHEDFVAAIWQSAPRGRVATPMGGISMNMLTSKTIMRMRPSRFRCAGSLVEGAACYSPCLLRRHLGYFVQ
mmetsp:Transcript_16405/g.49949  ORF Transcript_16405/g.49949 Transcript_16405/m.49949 type:complete len:81 (+) Transcript_16405:1274-1516(+)